MATVLILGASRGIGAALVARHLDQGDRVIATARDDAALARLRAAGAEALPLDVADPQSVSALAWRLDGEKLDIAWYVAGVMDRADAHTPPTREAFDRVMHTNVLGAMQVIPQVAPLVAAARGRMAFLSSVMGRIAEVSGSNAWLYRVSKAALNMAVASAQTAYPDAILVAVHPGWVQTDMGGAAAPLSVEQSAADLVALAGRLGPADRGAFLNHDGTRFAGW
ncbi:NADP-dependent 3-hydroxy acid dehydrogenase YdfG [Tibeticola sediminis]|uniref:NADP-dependent 3-hydroxy acid dehydrogenase YdfG n=1 Tax=Tibeticola sediminis TaxID=1917811 RepID=A0A3N4UKC1_9BURK|nr:SDR family oxidoreductase [Tibeticola sediminis]RPE67801.1 NADP-dependent 3-hydroxy acid dehydrogenase YdfG [Tibeticola sediminis]